MTRLVLNVFVVRMQLPGAATVQGVEESALVDVVGRHMAHVDILISDRQRGRDVGRLEPWRR